MLNLQNLDWKEGITESCHRQLQRPGLGPDACVYTVTSKKDADTPPSVHAAGNTARIQKSRGPSVHAAGNTARIQKSRGFYWAGRGHEECWQVDERRQSKACATIMAVQACFSYFCSKILPLVDLLLSLSASKETWLVKLTNPKNQSPSSFHHSHVHGVQSKGKKKRAATEVAGGSVA
eukprot:1159650-Pelagomonas_calceolata.AAC.17